VQLNTGSGEKRGCHEGEREGSRQNEEEVNWYKTGEEGMVNTFDVETNDRRDAVKFGTEVPTFGRNVLPLSSE